jgi:transcription elongation factor Elf1
MARQPNEDQAKQTFAEKLAAAITEGGCPKCGSLTRVIVHDPKHPTPLRQCGNCGNKFEFKEIK